GRASAGRHEVGERPRGPPGPARAVTLRAILRARAHDRHGRIGHRLRLGLLRQGTIDCGAGRDTARIRTTGAFKTRNCERIRHFCAHGENGRGQCLRRAQAGHVGAAALERAAFLADRVTARANMIGAPAHR
ncbi:MAG TPA: hypothetical protein VG474_09410, partial [Solirubrobacteraceae bacterium]|nr:hypothetical protein [Solirubrobacteraceae bacterium]